MPETLIIPVMLGGLTGGRELSGNGMLHFDGEMIRIEVLPAASGEMHADPSVSAIRRLNARMRWPVTWLDGVRHRGDELTLYLRDGDVIELTGPARLSAIADAIENDARALGELTRGLRSLGARRRGAASGSEQSRFFAPLLKARRLAEKSRVGRGPDPLAAFDGEALRVAIGSAVAELAHERYPTSAPDRRALEAELEECAEPLLEGMSSIIDTANAVRRGPDDSRLVHWRAWSREVRTLFERADRCWVAMAPVLENAPPPPRRPWWRRALRLGPARGTR
jgi:hypothetical protein